MKRFSLLSYSFLTASLLSLAACGGDDEPAEFSSATDLQKQRAVAAASGADAAIGFLYGSILGSVGPETLCPSVSRAGDTVTAVGNCTTDSGDKLTGTIIAKNVPSFFGGPENDPSKPAIVTFLGFSNDDVSDDNEDITLDGVVTLHPDGALTAAVAVTMQGILVASDATWRRPAELASADEGSTIEIDGLGSAEIKGSWNMDTDAPAGVLELHGSDVLKANFGAVAGGCVPLTVDDRAAGQICDTSNE